MFTYTAHKSTLLEYCVKVCHLHNIICIIIFSTINNHGLVCIGNLLLKNESEQSFMQSMHCIVNAYAHVHVWHCQAQSMQRDTGILKEWAINKNIMWYHYIICMIRIKCIFFILYSLHIRFYSASRQIEVFFCCFFFFNFHSLWSVPLQCNNYYREAMHPWAVWSKINSRQQND